MALIKQKTLIGILFAHPIFRLSSLGGLTTDRLMEFIRTTNKIDDNYFTRVFNPSPNPNEYVIGLSNVTNTNALTINSTEFILEKLRIDNQILDLNDLINDTKLLWSEADKVLNLTNIRRVGLKEEYLIDTSDNRPSNSATEILTKLTKLKFYERPYTSNSTISFSYRYPLQDGSMPSNKSDQYWNVLVDLASVNNDESSPGMIKLGIDVQKFFNPLLDNPSDSYKEITERFAVEKKQVIERLNLMGLLASV